MSITTVELIRKVSPIVALCEFRKLSTPKNAKIDSGADRRNIEIKLAVTRIIFTEIFDRIFTNPENTSFTINTCT